MKITLTKKRGPISGNVTSNTREKFWIELIDKNSDFVENEYDDVTGAITNKVCKSLCGNCINIYLNVDANNCRSEIYFTGVSRDTNFRHYMSLLKSKEDKCKKCFDETTRIGVDTIKKQNPDNLRLLVYENDDNKSISTKFCRIAFLYPKGWNEASNEELQKYLLDTYNVLKSLF